MKKIFFHIGNFKTGTSSIQAAFSNQSSLLEAKNIVYFRGFRSSNNPTNHSLFALEMLASRSGNSIKPFWYQESHDYPALVEELIRQINDSNCNNFILSSEEFCRCTNIHSEVLKNLRERLKTSIPQCEIIVLLFVRHPFDFIKSWYGQINKIVEPYADRTTNLIEYFMSRGSSFWSQYPTFKLFSDNFADRSLCAYYSNGVNSVALICSMLKSFNCDISEADFHEPRENISQLTSQNIELLRLVHRKVSYDDATMSRNFSISLMLAKIREINDEFFKFIEHGLFKNPPDSCNRLSFDDIISHYSKLLISLAPFSLVNQKEINLLRDRALKEKHIHPYEALICLKLTHKFRPKGPRIISEIKKLEERLGLMTS